MQMHFNTQVECDTSVSMLPLDGKFVIHMMEAKWRIYTG